MQSSTTNNFYIVMGVLFFAQSRLNESVAYSSLKVKRHAAVSLFKRTLL
ncbi:hypothetical protein YPPY34_4538 [Yersinia pestis PY-34]|nr:hypothetical protein YPPY34_4538 [Yersinia pestis PY-34]EIT38779.1 hypothetical protein YPPY101_4450 [Yersinia pestis PY-101]